jgi:hypothetical protein
MSSKPFVGVIVVALLAAVGVSSHELRDDVAGDSAGRSFAQDLPALQKNDKIAARVNGTEIRASVVDATWSASQAGGQNKTKAEVLDGLIDFELLVQEGERLGLEPTAEEIENAIAETKSSAAPEAVKEALEYSARMGKPISDNEYWESDAYREEMRRSITAGRAGRAIAEISDRRPSPEEVGRAAAKLRAGAHIERFE